MTEIITGTREKRMLAALQMAYDYILQTDGPLRFHNQHVFCAVRDAIAFHGGDDAMVIQNQHEIRALRKRALALENNQPITIEDVNWL